MRHRTEGLKEFLRGRVGRAQLASKIREVRTSLSHISKDTAIQAICLGITVLIAALVRSLPARWGFYLSEFDPYLQWRMSEYVVQNGFMAWFDWHDTMSWYPWGMTMRYGNLPGLAFTVASIYQLLRAVGATVTVFEICVLFPVVTGALACVAIYFLGREIWSKSVGLLSALFLALNTAHIERTSLGFLRHETVGIPVIIVTFLFFIRAIAPNRPLRSCLIYSATSALLLFYLSATWAAYIYPMDMIVLYAFALAILGRYTRRLLIGYSVTFGLFLFLTSNFVPKVGTSILSFAGTLAILGVGVVLVARELYPLLSNWRSRIYVGIYLTAALLLAIFLLDYLDFVGWPGGKFISVLNPFTRLQMPIVESVAEHRPATWASFFYEFGILTFLGIFGLIFTIQRSRNVDIFLILFGLSSLYFAASFVRLTLILSPALCVLAAITMVELGKPSVDIMREAVIFPKRRIRVGTRVGREFGVGIVLILLLITTPTFYYSTNSAKTPATIATSSFPIAPSTGQEQKYQDWLEALAWMRNNLPKDAVVFAWWDYGYWITVLGDRRTLADNGTQNTTQIAMIARTFLSNETRAIPMLKRYNVTHIVIFTTWTTTQQSQIAYLGYGEDNKWYWMTRIGNGTTFHGETVRFYERRTAEETKYFRVIQVGNRVIANETIADQNGVMENTILGKLMREGISSKGAVLTDYFRLVFSSTNRWVLLYEVSYPTKTIVTCSLSRSDVKYNETLRIAGRVVDQDNRPVPAAQVTIEYSENKGLTWNSVIKVSTNETGWYSYNWLSDAGQFLVRAGWEGVRGKYLAAKSDNMSLSVTRVPISISCTLSSYDIGVHQNVTITCQLSYPISTGNVTVQYSLDNVTWKQLATGVPHRGMYNLTFTPAEEGTLYIRAIFLGTRNYEETVSPIQVATVRSK